MARCSRSLLQSKPFYCGRWFFRPFLQTCDTLLEMNGRLKVVVRSTEWRVYGCSSHAGWSQQLEAAL